MDIRYEQRAELDLQELIAECECRGHPEPEQFTKLLRLRIRALALFPHSGRIVAGTGAREWLLHGTPYVVLYVPHPMGVDVLRVLDLKRQPTE